MECISLLLVRYIIVFHLAGLLIGGWIGSPILMQTDLDSFDSGEFDSAFVSMYTTEGFLESEYEKYRGLHIFKNQFEIKDERTLRGYLNHIVTSDKELKCLYLGVLPEIVGTKVIEEYVQSYPGLMFEVLPAYYDISDWQALGEKDREKRLQAYYELCEMALQYDNIRAYNYFGTEWLILNRMNYQQGLLLESGAASTVMLTADYLQRYLITQDNLEGTFSDLRKMITEWNPKVYPNYIGWNFVFLGDSIFGNYRDGTSIPHVIEGLTGANTFNLGIGATVAVPVDSCRFHLGKMIDLMENREYCSILDDDSDQMKQTLEAVNRDFGRLYEEDKDRSTVFFIHYGFNEYISNIPVEDTAQQIGFYSSLQQQIARLKKLYPKARIVVLVPNRILVYEQGQKITGENAYVLTDYVEAILRLEDSDRVFVINNYDVFLNEEGEIMKDCLADELHPNMKGRFLLGRNIALQLSDIFRK